MRLTLAPLLELLRRKDEQLHGYLAGKMWGHVRERCHYPEKRREAVIGMPSSLLLLLQVVPLPVLWFLVTGHELLLFPPFLLFS